MRAHELAETYPVIALDTPAVEAARRLAAGQLTGLVVVDERGRPSLVLPATQVLRLGVPGYIRDDPTLARVVDEAHADVFLRELGERTVGQCLSARTGELPVVDQDATVLEVAALMARARSPLVAVVDPGGALVGVITLQRLLNRVLSR